MHDSFPHKFSTPHSMDTAGKYHLLIDQHIELLVASAKNQEQFNESIVRLQAIVPTYGLTLRHINILLNEIIDPESSFRVSMKNKMITILIPREIIDFKTTMKIISVFKVSSYYTQRARIKLLPTTLQTKLAHTLTKNLTAIKWESNCLCFGNILFDLLAIGYLRPDISIFLLYFLNISKQIDSKYNLKFFFNIKRIESLIEFYDLDRKSILPLLIFTSWYLETIQRSDEFDTLHYKLKKTIENAKINKDTFGKMDTIYVSKLLAMERNTFEMLMIEDNILLITRIMSNLNSNFTDFLTPVSRKRKFLEDSQNTIESPELYGIYSTHEFLHLIECNRNHNILSILKYFSETSMKTYTPSHVNDIKIDKLELNFCSFNAPVYYMAEYNIESLNYQILQVLNIQNNVLKLTPDMQWIFKAISNINRFIGSIFPLMDDIFAHSISVEYAGNNADIIKILNVCESIVYLRPNFKKYQYMLEKCISHTFTFNDIELMKGLTRLVYNWKSSTVDYKQLLELIMYKFRTQNQPLIFELLQIYKSTHNIPPEILESNIILAPHVVVACITERNLLKIDLLLQHLLFCQRINVGEIYKKINRGYINDVFGILFDNHRTGQGIVGNMMKFYISDDTFKLKTMIGTTNSSNEEVSVQMKEMSYLGIHEFYEAFKYE